MEITLVIHASLMAAMVLGGLRAATATDRRALLLGGFLTTIGLMGTLWIAEISTITVLLAVMFLAFDFMMFAFSGSIKLLPEREPEGRRSSRIYAALVVWFILSLLLMALYFVWGPESVLGGTSAATHRQLTSEVLNNLWGQQDFFLYLMGAIIFSTAVGSFFMIEQEK